MKISKRFNLNPAPLDFVDVDTNNDIRLFIHPRALRHEKDKDTFSRVCSKTIDKFNFKIIDLVKKGKEEKAINLLFEHLHEPKFTCLGYCRKNIIGRGGTIDSTKKILSRIKTSKAIRLGIRLSKTLEDNLLFVPGFGIDKLSDMTTNIIRKHLINYTNEQCMLHGIGVKPKSKHLIIDGRKILFVPKRFVVRPQNNYTAWKYYRSSILDFLQKEQLREDSDLVKIRINGERYVTKKSIVERYPFSKKFLREFTREHPEVLSTFKETTTLEPLTDREIAAAAVQSIRNN